MITKEFLASCTDEQINRGIIWKLASNRIIGEKSIGFYENRDVGAMWIYDKHGNARRFNPCSRHGDIMPVAFDNMFGVYPIFTNSNTYRAESRCGIYSFNENPLRAICETYILIEAAK